MPGIGLTIYSRLDGFILFGSFILPVLSLRDERKYYKPEDHGFTAEGEVPEGTPQSGKEAWLYALISVVALTVTFAGAMLTLSVTEVIVGRTGIGGSLIGVLTLGVASALPELITAVSGIRKGTGIPLGTLVAATSPIRSSPLAAGRSSPRIGPLSFGVWDLPWETLTTILDSLVVQQGPHWEERGHLSAGAVLRLR